MRTAFSRTWLLVTLVALAPTCACKGGSAPPFKAAQLEHGTLRQISGGWILELDGSPAERGRAEGQLLKDQIRWLVPRYLKAAFGSSEIPSGQTGRLQKLAAGIPEPHRQQLDALAAAVDLPIEPLLAANLSTELFASQMCSCLGITAEKSRDGKVRLARNLDWMGGELLAGVGLLVIEGGTGNRFASLSFPGLVGAVTGINERGLSVANLMVLRQHGQIQPGVPVLFAVRSLLEGSGSVSEALTWLREAKHTIPQNYALADPINIAAVETGPSVFRARAQAIVTNFFGEDQGKPGDGRYHKLVEAFSQEKLGIEDLEAALERAAIPTMNIQAAIFEPAKLIIRFSIGKVPAASGPWVRLDLTPLLKRER